MAPTDQKMKNSKFTAKHGDWKKSQHNAHGVKKKRKWIPEQKVFEGSVKEGQGFAFQRKQKVQHDYNKLLRREKRKNPESKALYKDEYPEHLRHLYLAEAEKLKKEAWTNRLNRSKQRMKGQEKREKPGKSDPDPDPDPAAEAAADPDPEVSGGSEQTTEPAAASEKDGLPMSNRMKKKMLKKTSYQKTKEEFETVREKRRKKKEEYQKKCQQREEAIQKYKQKKMETFQMLSKKTKKGQPNLNLQMEHLLQQITQRTGK